MLFYNPKTGKSITRWYKKADEFSKIMEEARRKGWIYQNTHYISEEEVKETIREQ